MNWKPIADPPEHVTTVLTFDPHEDSEPIWLGYLEDGVWYSVEGMRITPTHWMELPEVPG